MELIALDKPIGAPVIDFECDRIRAADNIAINPAVLKIDGVAKLTKGNISAWQGIAKSKKTFALTLTVASVVAARGLHHKFEPVGNGAVAWFDTEQSPFDAQKITKRIAAMCSSDSNLHFYALRRYGYKTRVEKIEAYLQEHGAKLDLLVIDGLRDLVLDFNDPVECSNITTKLMAWSIDYDCHITTVLHANKGDGYMRGHLGTELENKCEAAFAVVKDENKKDVSLVSEKFGRGKEIEDFEIIINDQGLPEIVDGSHFEYDNAPAPY